MVLCKLCSLLHLFCFSGRELIIEMFLYQQPYLNAVQTMCPHVLRYLATAVVINKNSRRAAMKVIGKLEFFIYSFIFYSIQKCVYVHISSLKLLTTVY